MGIIRFAIKSGLTASAVYWTHTNNVWGTSHETGKLYDKLASDAAPTVQSLKAKLPFDVPHLPSTGETCFLVKHYYNNGVKSTVHFVHRLPCYLGKWAKAAQDKINSALEAPAPAKE